MVEGSRHEGWLADDFQVQAWENEPAVDLRRKEMELDPIAIYMKRMIATYGEHCL